jgi:2-polyprenyl-3-methyl-5-hydroxy-6-metoxy-1,4-benzoquinol methylase
LPLDRTTRHLCRLYRQSPDPWGHATRAYERAKFARTIAALDGRRFRQAVEIGCGIGVLTELLARRCEALLGIDCVASAVASARLRLAGQSHVRLGVGVAPDDLPHLSPDLIVLSEVLYFMTRAEIIRLAAWCDAHAAPAARIVIVSWNGPTGEALSGPASAALLCRSLVGWSHRSLDGDGYRIDRLDRLDG